MKNIIILKMVVVLFAVGHVSAEPIINSTSGTWNHKTVVTISGSEFGTKSPVKPLIWDDCEGETAGAFPKSTANSYSQVGYSDAQPADWRDGEDIPDTPEINYRNAPHTAVSTAITAPHYRSTKFISGGHYEDAPSDQSDPASGRSVSLTVSTPSGYAERWFATWYTRNDPAWPTACPGANEKITALNAGTSEYSTGFYYVDLTTRSCNDAGYITVRTQNGGPAGGSCEGVTDNNPPWYYNPQPCDLSNAMMNTPRDGWVRYEQRVANDDCFLWFLVDNKTAWHGTGNTNWFTDMGMAGIRSFTIGGYMRVDLVGGSGRGYQDSNAFRYFDDIYVDSTLSRIILANNSNYEDATITEPQIPSAWNSNGNFITCTVNLGKLPASITAYLFVFNADNKHNPVGFAVEIGGSGGGESFPGVGNSLVLDKECKICSQCGYSSDEFFHICPECGKECGSQ